MRVDATGTIAPTNGNAESVSGSQDLAGSLPRKDASRAQPRTRIFRSTPWLPPLLDEVRGAWSTHRALLPLLPRVTQLPMPMFSATDSRFNPSVLCSTITSARLPNDTGPQGMMKTFPCRRTAVTKLRWEGFGSSRRREEECAGNDVERFAAW